MNRQDKGTDKEKRETEENLKSHHHHVLNLVDIIGHTDDKVPRIELLDIGIRKKSGSCEKRLHEGPKTPLEQCRLQSVTLTPPATRPTRATPISQAPIL